MAVDRGMEQHLKNRQSRPDINILDIPYNEVTGPSEAAATKVYEFCGMTLRDEGFTKHTQLGGGESHPQIRRVHL